MPQDPMAMARAVQAIMGQAGAWLTQYKSDRAARGLGFSPEDLAETRGVRDSAPAASGR
jgi:hypothetical protein